MTEPPALPGMDAPAPTLDLDEPLDPKLANRPLEPGSGTPDLNAIMRRVRDERGQPAKSSETDAAKSDFIAAARRAAQAAAAEAEIMKRHPDIAGPVRGMKLGNLFSGKRKPVLMAAAAIMVALAGLQLSKAFFTDDAEIAGAQQESAPVADQAAAPAAEQTEMAAPAASETPPADETAAADATGEPQADQPEMQAAPEMATSDDSAVDTANAGMTAAPQDEAAADDRPRRRRQPSRRRRRPTKRRPR